MATITVNKAAIRCRTVESNRNTIGRLIPVSTLLASIFTLLSNNAVASGWEIEPSLQVGTIYSDNIDLEPKGESDLVFEVTPGVRVKRDSRRLRVSLDYRLQNLKYVDNSDLDTSNNQLSATVNAEALADTLYVDFSSYITQQLVDRRRSGSSDGISGSGNRSDVFSYSISPYWVESIGNIADFELRYTYDMVSTDDSLSDSDGNGVAFDIVNGPATGKFNWLASFNKRNVSYDDGDKSDTESGSTKFGYQLTPQFNPFVSGRYQNNDFIGNRGNAQPDDSSVGAGVTWTPSQDFNLTLAYNERLDPSSDQDDNFISGDVFWAPSARTRLNVGLENNFFGESWNGRFTHETRWTRWNFSYSEGTSDFRSLVLQQNFIACPSGATSIAQCRTLASGEALSPGEFRLGEDQGLASVDANISANTFINKTGRASVSVVGARNTVTLAATDIRREFVADNDTERDSSVDLSWRYTFSPLTNSLIIVGRTQREFDDGDEDEFMRYAWRVTRQIGSDSIFYVEAQVRSRDSNVSTRQYDENRLTVSFQKFF